MHSCETFRKLFDLYANTSLLYNTVSTIAGLMVTLLTARVSGNGSDPSCQLDLDPALKAFLSASDGRISGWVSEPNLRGTWSIIWTCLATSFISTYTMLCLNVPARKDTPVMLFRRKLLWMTLAIIGPEIVLTYAAGQWSRAMQSVEAFKTSGFPQWTARLAFFADMGGFVLQTSDGVSFPTNAKQLHWLVTNGHVEYPSIQPEEVWDKSKQDRLAKAISAIQVAYLVLQSIGRAIQHLAITTLELNALAIVVCSLMTAFAWLHKPTDVRTPFPIATSRTVDELCGTKEWTNTPLDFVDENGPGWSMNLQPFMKMPVIPSARPIRRIPNDRFPTNPYKTQEYGLCFATLLFTGIHLIGWNFSFPSLTERVLWRVSSSLLFGVTVAFWVLETAASWVRLGRWRRLYLRMFEPDKLAQLESQQADASIRSQKSTPLPQPWEFWTILPIACLYGLARLYLLVEGFIELRDVAASAFLEVNWSIYFPHI